MKKLENHPYANYFPMMTPGEMDALVEDIKQNGLRTPIILYQEKILDGRNRHSACSEADVEPRFEEFTGTDEEALRMVISHNIQRRNLKPGQRAIVAAKAWLAQSNGKESKDGKKRKNERLSFFETQVELAKRFNSSHASIRQAAELLKEAPDLAALVFSGDKTLSDAMEDLQKRHDDQARRERNLELLKKYEEIRQAVEEEKMTLEEAMDKVVEEQESEREQEEREVSSRQIWLEGLEKAIAWFEDWCQKDCDDEHMAWYTEKDAPGTEHEITRERAVSVIVQLKRIIKLCLRR